MNVTCEYCDQNAVVSAHDDGYQYDVNGIDRLMHLCDDHATVYGCSLSADVIHQLHLAMQ